jgi:hypothetical protein
VLPAVRPEIVAVTEVLLDPEALVGELVTYAVAEPIDAADVA